MSEKFCLIYKTCCIIVYWQKNVLFYFVILSDESLILNAVTFLVENGAVVNSERGKDSPLHFAVASELRRTIEFLIEKGANINHVGNGDITPLLTYILKNGKMHLNCTEFYQYLIRKLFTWMCLLAFYKNNFQG